MGDRGAVAVDDRGALQEADGGERSVVGGAPHRTLHCWSSRGIERERESVCESDETLRNVCVREDYIIYIRKNFKNPTVVSHVLTLLPVV